MNEFQAAKKKRFTKQIQRRGKVMDGDCLKCGLCTAACPKKALSL